MKQANTRDIPNLDFLRAVAVLLVFARHIVSETSLNSVHSIWFEAQVLGIMGVFLFFVHTSLVLMFSLERTWVGSSIISNSIAFYTRRFFRIYPLSIFIVCLIAFVLIPLFGAKELQFTQLDLPGILSNIFLVQNVTMYNQESSRDILGVLWSLPLEVQMYLTLPFLFVFARSKKLSSLIYVWLGAIAFAILIVTLKVPYNLVKYIPCFIPGIIAYKLWGKKQFIPFIILPIAIFVLAMYYMAGYHIIGGGKETPLGYLVCITIGLLLPFLKPMKNVSLAYVSKSIATYSYGIYLSHSIVNRFVFKMLPDMPFALLVLVSMVGTLAVSMLLYHLVEKPFIRVGTKTVSRYMSNKLNPASSS